MIQLLFATLLSLGARAQAQGGPVLVVFGSVGDPGEQRPEVAAQAERALRASGAEVLAAAEAVRRFERVESTAPLPTEQDEIELLARCADQALYQVATGRRQQAQQTVATCMRRAERALESLNREAVGARNLFDSCLFVVRALLEQGNENGAYAEAMRCRRLVPDIVPSPRLHPPDVRDLVRRADADLRNAPQSRLRVESEPPGCATFVNGRRLGTTPLQLDELPAGPYRVQVECSEGRMGRVHLVELGARPVELRVDTIFETALRLDREGAGLVYESEEQFLTRGARDAARIGRAAGVAEVWLVASVGGRLRLERTAPAGDVLGLAIASSPGDLAQGIAAARQGRRVEVSGGLVRPLPEPRPVPVAHASASGPAAGGESRVQPARGSSVQRGPVQTAEVGEPVGQDTGADIGPRDAGAERGPGVAGWVLGSVGLAGVAGGWLLYAQRLERLRQLDVAHPDDADYAIRVTRYDEVALPQFALLGIGAAGLVAALPFWLPRERDVPWWGWAAGGAGAVAGAVGGWLIVDAEGCQVYERDETCAIPRRTAGIGATVAISAVPLLAVPVTMLLRRAGPYEAHARLQLVDGRASLMLSVGGAL